MTRQSLAGERRLMIGTAGWAIPRAVAEAFPQGGSALERYSARFHAAEINSTFYRSHRNSTYERWARATPPDFRFAVKMPRSITHEARRTDVADAVAAFVAEVHRLEGKAGPILIQLPPSLAFDAVAHAKFFALVRDLWAGPVACELRHASWFEPDADALLRDHRVARVAADPARIPAAANPGGWPELAYWRLHGSPRMYYSPYEEGALEALASSLLAADAQEVWCIFDNTASGAAAADALRLLALLEAAKPGY